MRLINHKAPVLHNQTKSSHQAWKNLWKLTVSPSLVHGRPFCRYFPWLWRFFWPPSANLHNKGSGGTAPMRKYHVKWTITLIFVNACSVGSDYFLGLEMCLKIQCPINTSAQIYRTKNTNPELQVESWYIFHWNVGWWPHISPLTPSYKKRPCILNAIVSFLHENFLPLSATRGLTHHG